MKLCIEEAYRLKSIKPRVPMGARLERDNLTYNREAAKFLPRARESSRDKRDKFYFIEGGSEPISSRRKDPRPTSSYEGSDSESLY